MSDRCAACGAVHSEGSSCQTNFEEFLSLEYTNPAYGQVHFLTVACFMIQHRRYSDAALTWMQSMLHIVTLSALCIVARFDSYQPVNANGEVKPMRKALRWRFWLETSTAIVTSILFVITLLQSDWIEVVFGVNPDSRSGILEWLIVAALLVLMITLFTLASYEWRKARVAIS